MKVVCVELFTALELIWKWTETPLSQRFFTELGASSKISTCLCLLSVLATALGVGHFLSCLSTEAEPTLHQVRT